jgi:hypothetical protein
MDELQDRLVRLALGVLDEHGFALAGGYALQAHGLVERMALHFAAGRSPTEAACILAAATADKITWKRITSNISVDSAASEVGG